MSIKRQLSSSGFRIVGLYVFFYLITAIGFLWLMFSVLGSEIKNSVKADIERENSLIIDGLDENSDDALHKRLLPYIEKADVLSEVYILLDSSGNVLLTNYPYDVKLELGWAYLDELEDEDEPYEDDDDDDDGILFGYLDFDIIPENSEDEGYIGWVSKVGEQTLLVGRTLDRIDETKDIFVRMALIVFPLSLILAILGGMIFNRLTTRRIEVINEQCRSIRRQGDLSLRVPNEKPDDEYGLLIANINAMLDTIDKGVRNVQEVSNDVAHDLRTPLTRIKYGLEAGLLNENTTKTELSEILETSLSETDSLLDTFSAILRISQLNTGLRKSRFKVFDLTYLVQTIVEAYAPTAEENGHKLTAMNDEYPCLVNGDKDMIGQLMSNLIENAFQHAGDALDIKVSVECRPNDVVLSVQDNGVGIAEDEHEEIFNKFYRIDKSRTKSGSGLGLASAKAIIELHDGTIHVENCKPGLKFCVTFPRNVTQG